YGGDRATLAAAREALGRPARVGAGPTRFCALAAALAVRSRRALVLDGKEAQRWLAQRPIGLLGFRAETEALLEPLERLGVRTLGELARLSRPALADRFGRAGVLAHRLACGEDEPLRPRRAQERRCAWASGASGPWRASSGRCWMRRGPFARCACARRSPRCAPPRGWMRRCGRCAWISTLACPSGGSCWRRSRIDEGSPEPAAPGPGAHGGRGSAGGSGRPHGRAGARVLDGGRPLVDRTAAAAPLLGGPEHERTQHGRVSRSRRERFRGLVHPGAVRRERGRHTALRGAALSFGLLVPGRRLAAG